MRISDWSSDVCSSDLIDDVVAVREVERTARHFLRRLRCHGLAGTEPVCTLPGIAVGDAHLVGRLEAARVQGRSEEHTSELQSLMRISYAVFCLKKKTIINKNLQTKSKCKSTQT